MNKKALIADLNLLFVTLIWGTTFVIVQKAIMFLAPFSFNCIRFFLASFFLLLWMVIKRKTYRGVFTKMLTTRGLLLGFFLYLGYGFQTLGLLYTSSSKAGFITGLSVILVPFLSIVILRTSISVKAVISAVLALFGLFLLTKQGSLFQMNKGDAYVLLCAVSFALHIIFTGKFAKDHPSIVLTFVQLLAVSVLSGFTALLSENWFQLFSAAILLKPEVWTAILATSLLATSLAFLLQTYFQTYTTPARVAVIFSMEPVFAFLTSYIWLGEQLSKTALFGCFFIFSAMVLSELPIRKLSFNRKKNECANL